MFDDQYPEPAAMPMTGTGVQRRTLPPAPVDPVDEYLVPARPSVLATEANPANAMAVRLLKRRLTLPGFGYRRL